MICLRVCDIQTGRLLGREPINFTFGLVGPRSMMLAAFS
jgi:hypothetical protein